VSTEPKTRLTPEQYLEIERQAEFKSEYYDGEMFPMQGPPETLQGPALAMAGAGWAHNRLVANAILLLGTELRSRPCQVVSSDMRVRVSATGLYTYPDVTVVCGDPQFLAERRDTLLTPTLIVEVLSPSTEAYDRGRKFEHYRSVESLNEYLLIASERVQVDLFTRQSDGHWLFTSAASLEDVLELKSVGCRLALAELYSKVELAES